MESGLHIYVINFFKEVSALCTLKCNYFGLQAYFFHLSDFIENRLRK